MTPVVLFDLDGTLINTKRLYLECYRRAILPYVGREWSTEEILALRPRSEFRFLKDVVGEERFSPCLEAFYREYAALHDEQFRGIYTGVPEMLAALRQARLTLGIVTGKSRRSWEVTSARTTLGPFQTLIFDDDVSEPKPDPQGILLALEQVRAAPARTFYLGDSVSDIEAAIAAGVIPAGAIWAKKGEDRDRFRARLEPLGARIFETPGAFAQAVLGERRASPAHP